MSNCQITFLFGDQSEHIAVTTFDKNTPQPFAVLQQVAYKQFSLKGDVYFMYEDDDGDFVTLASDADALEAFAVHEDAGQDDILLTVKVNNPVVESKPASNEKLGAKGDDELVSDSEVKEEASQFGAHTFLDENFVLEFCSFLGDPAVRQAIPEVAANIAADILKKASAQELYSIAALHPVFNQKKLFTQEWPFGKTWASQFDQWIMTLTDDQLGKVAFQVPIIAARLVAKREKLHKAIFVKHKNLGKLLKIAQFEFGSVDFASLLDNASKNASGDQTVGHIGTVCAFCAASPIQGVRYRCMVCPAFDVCEDCEAKAAHPAEHAMMKFRSSAAGYVGLTHASSLYGKKAVKHQLKALKKEAKLAKKGEKHGKHVKKHGKHGLPPEYVEHLSFAAAVGGGVVKKPVTPVQGSFAPVAASADFPSLGASYGPKKPY